MPTTKLSPTRVSPYNKLDSSSCQPKESFGENQHHFAQVQDAITGTFSIKPNAYDPSPPYIVSKYDTVSSQDPKYAMAPIFLPSGKRKEDHLEPLATRTQEVHQSTPTPSQKGVKFALDRRSSIPIAVHRNSADHLSVKHSMLNEAPTRGLRVVDKPRGPRSRLSAEQPDFSTPQTARKLSASTALNFQSTSLSMSSKALDDNHNDPALPERPPTVFTGEYRTRLLTGAGTTGQQSRGPILRIASSAENIIMGTNSHHRNNTVPQRSNITRNDYPTPIILKYERSPKDSLFALKEMSLPSHTTGSVQERTPVVRNFCRPQTSLENLPGNRPHSKDLSIPRKPVDSPSLGEICSPSSVSFHDHIVSEFPGQYSASQEEGVPLLAPQAEYPITPTRSVSELMGILTEPETVGGGSTPKAAERAIKINLHPPRKSSLRALSDFPTCPEPVPSSTKADEPYPKEVPGNNRSPTFHDIRSRGPIKTSAPLDVEKAQLPESKSNHILGSFRNIFKSRTSSTDKTRSKKGESNPDLLEENEIMYTNTGTVNTDNDPDKTPKPKPIYTKLPGSVSWNKNSRTFKISDGLPGAVSMPRLLSPPNRFPGSDTPSFARPTKSTRTRAALELVTRTPTTLKPRARRTHVRTGSTGSPRAANRVSQRSNTSTPPSRKVTQASQTAATNQLGSLCDKAPSVIGSLKVPEHAQRCLEILCKKCAMATTELEREKYFQLALGLQEKLSNYRARETLTIEFDKWMKEKCLEKDIAEGSLKASLTEVQNRLDKQ